MEREMGLEPTTTCLEGRAVAESRIMPYLNLKSGRKLPLFPTGQMTGFFYLPLLA